MSSNEGCRVPGRESQYKPVLPRYPAPGTRYLIGIDLGTTNSAVAYIDAGQAGEPDAPDIHLFHIPQLIAAGEVGELPTLPSFLYFAADHEVEGGLVALPWQQRPAFVVGELAREQGALVPGRQVDSAKSWLCNSAVDRTAKILPWGAEPTDQACSPVEASAFYLAHIRDAWNHVFAGPQSPGDEARFEHQDIVLTVPASFDEEARELTVQAARRAGIEKLTLLEEPLAAFYAWVVANRASLKRKLRDGYLVLICDVGGGTTDFSLIRVRVVDKQVKFERIAIGEHLLLGGDNVDLALARRVEEKLGNPRLTLRQRNALRRGCCAAKERLLGDGRIERASITLLGSGRAVIGSALSSELTRREVEEALVEGFLPMTASDDLPARHGRAGLRELGLPYATEPAITRHLAEFLTQSFEAVASPGDEPIPDNPQSGMVRPDAILFNGGFFTPEVTRSRVVEAVSGWFREKGKRYRPKVLSNEMPESAVAVGAAYYNQVRRGGGLRISGGSPRAYYIGVQAARAGGSRQMPAVCVMPRGTEEGTELELSGREFTVLTNRPVSFTLYSSTSRHEGHGDLVTLDEEDVHRHAPLITVLRYGKRSRQAELTVRLTVRFTEVGTLELWCESQKTEHRWRLQFQLRGADLTPEPAEQEPEQTETIIAEEATESAARMIRAVFGNSPAGGARGPASDGPLSPEAIVSRLEATLGYGKDAWPMAAIRKLGDVLADVSEGRKRSARLEARWLNLFGFCLRPGFGAVLDDWRMDQARKIYLAGLAFPKEIQCQVEWLILWRRLAGGLNAGQQQELLQRHMAMLGVGGKKQAGRLNTQIEREGWRMLASLEHLPSAARANLGRHLLRKISDEPTNKSFLWSIGRLGARIPLYGPLNCVVAADTAAEWLAALLKPAELTADAASAVVQLGARTDDPARDIRDGLRERAIKRLSAAAVSEGLIESLRRHVPPARSDALRIFGESLPEGLRLSK